MRELFVSSELVGTRSVSSEVIDSINRSRGRGACLCRHYPRTPGPVGLVYLYVINICDQQISEPEAMSFSGVIRMTLPSASSAQRIMPWDSMPASLAGFKLVMTMTFLPTISSGV